MNKFRVFINFYKEEAFINNITKQDYRLVKRNWCYFTFEKAEKSYQYIIDYYENKDEIKSDYLKFLDDLGLHYLTNNDGWIYIEKELDGENFELYTDYSSRLERANRSAELTRNCLYINILAFLFNVIVYLMNPYTVSSILRITILSASILLPFITSLLLSKTLFDIYKDIKKDSQQNI